MANTICNLQTCTHLKVYLTWVKIVLLDCLILPACTGYRSLNGFYTLTVSYAFFSFYLSIIS